MNLSILTWLARVPCGIVYEIPRVILTQRSRGKANVARNVGSCSHVSFMRALLKIRRVSSSSFRTLPSFQRSHDSLISTSFAGTRRNTRWKRKSRVSPIFSSPPFFHVYIKFYCPPLFFSFLDKNTRKCFRSTRRSRTKRTWRRMRTTPSPASRKRVSRVSERKSRRVENYTVKLVLIDLTFILRMKLAYQFLSRFTFLVFVSLVVRGSSKKKEKETRRNDSVDSNQNRIWNNTTANILSKYSLSDKILIRSIVSIDRSFNRIHDWLANLCKKIW